MSETAEAVDFTEVKSFDYLEEANVTASNAFHGELVSPQHIKSSLDRAVTALQQLDLIKKALFYGRAIPGNAIIYPTNQFGISTKMPDKIDPDDRQRAELIFHSIVGIATEAGELLEMLENVLFNGQAFDDVNFIEENGDVQWYQAIGLRAIKATFGDVQHRNIAKLRHRFPQKFNEYDANNRDLFGERKILEGSEPDSLRKLAADKGKQLAHLENWHVDAYRRCLWGNISGHPRQAELERNNPGAYTHTSVIVELNQDAGYCETKNTIYELGNPVI